jgi:hypothetical protein
MFDTLTTGSHQLTPSAGPGHHNLGEAMTRFYRRFDACTLFLYTAHELTIFGAAAVQPAHPYLLPELPAGDIEASIPAGSPSRGWVVIGHFGSRDEALILEPATGQLLLFRWMTYPEGQPRLAGSLDELIARLGALTDDEPVQALTGG